jgi:DNA-binding GntR family transcriptional regulator
LDTRRKVERAPAYRLLASELRHAILAGGFLPSQRLPTEAELSERRGLSRQTVRHAFEELVAEGLVYRVRGRGSFAMGPLGDEKYLRSMGSVDDLLALSVDTQLDVVQPLKLAVDVVAAGRLRLNTDEVMIGLFRRLHRASPFSVTEIYLPPEIGSRVAADARISRAGAVSSTTLIGMVEEAGFGPTAGAHQSITGTAVPTELGELIDCAPGAPVLRIDRLYFDVRGDMVELAISYYNPERYSYRVQLRRAIRHR